MKAVVVVLTLLCFALFVGGLNLSFDPFEVKLESWQRMVGLILLFFSILFFGYVEFRKGYREGYIDASDDAIEVLEKYKKELEEKYKDMTK